MNGISEKLRAVVPTSIAARGAILLLMVAVSIVGPAIVAQRLLAGQTNADRQYEVETLLAAALSAYLDYAPQHLEEYDEWLPKIEERGLRVRWAGVFGPDGRGLEFRRRASLPREQIVAQIDFDADEPTRQWLAIEGVRSRRFELYTVPQPDAGVTLAAIIDRGAPGTAAQPVSAAVVVLVAAMFTGLLVSWLWFRYTIEGPVRSLRRRVLKIQQGLAEVAEGDKLPAELGALVQAAQEMQRELEQWRVEAKHWRRNVDDAVDTRTRQAALAQRRAERDADTDSLTKLGNRRVFERELPRLFEQHQARGELSLILLDVNNFKQLNDTCGHAAGDRLLAFVGELMRATVRKGTDVAVRLGGDEFVLILPGRSVMEAMEIAKRLVSLFAQKARTHFKADPPPGLSAGVSSLREHGAQTWQELVKLGDLSMYLAKRKKLGVATLAQATTGR